MVRARAADHRSESGAGGVGQLIGVQVRDEAGAYTRFQCGAALVRGERAFVAERVTTLRERLFRRFGGQLGGDDLHPRMAIHLRRHRVQSEQRRDDVAARPLTRAADQPQETQLLFD